MIDILAATAAGIGTSVVVLLALLPFSDGLRGDDGLLDALAFSGLAALVAGVAVFLWVLL